MTVSVLHRLYIMPFIMSGVRRYGLALPIGPSRAGFLSEDNLGIVVSFKNVYG
jgi:hypothetical protein